MVRARKFAGLVYFNPKFTAFYYPRRYRDQYRVDPKEKYNGLAIITLLTVLAVSALSPIGWTALLWWYFPSPYVNIGKDGYDPDCVLPPDLAKMHFDEPEDGDPRTLVRDTKFLVDTG